MIPIRPVETNNEPQRLAQAHLKCCPLCDALNAVTNDECFVCGWSGRFGSDLGQIEASLFVMLSSCPTIASEAKSKWRQWFRRKLDLRS